MKRLTRLGPKHIAAARMRVEGRTNAEIATELRVKVDTLYEWFSDEKIKEEISRQLTMIDHVFAERMAEMAMVGVGELIAMARMPLADQTLTAHQKLEIVREMLDRTPATAKVGAASSGGSQVNNFILPPDMPIEQLVARGRQLLLKAANGSAPDSPTE